MASNNADELLHESTTTSVSDVRHSNPLDQTGTHIWLLEPPTAHGVLTQDGITQIEEHKYVSGSYTFLDNLLNPIWTSLTELLPITMAPNLVTFIGGLHCLAAYLVSWSYAPNLDQHVPNWVLMFNAYCTMTYYTFDCMDGKQARRTNSSSPLGQLFDHGMDCLCLLAHLSTVHICLADGQSDWFWYSQGLLMFPFFVAQWEEYHTGILPHSTGDIGVTEVNYGQAVFSLVNAFVDRESIYTEAVVNKMGTGWVAMMLPLTIMSILRVFSTQKTIKGKLSALSKLVSPLLLVLSPFVVSSEVRRAEFRFLHLMMGLAMVLVTIKVVVFSMAKQSYAAVQGDIFPCLLAVIWVRHDPRLTVEGVGLLFRTISIWYLCRIVYWAHSFIYQVCSRLGIRLFIIESRS